MYQTTIKKEKALDRIMKLFVHVIDILKNSSLTTIKWKMKKFHKNISLYSI